MPRIGGHKLYYLIKQDASGCGYKFGEKKLFSVLREHGLLVKKAKKACFHHGQQPLAQPVRQPVLS
jgi:hypothetical protein